MPGAGVGIIAGTLVLALASYQLGAEAWIGRRAG
jgi:hypothetical protein